MTNPVFLGTRGLSFLTARAMDADSVQVDSCIRSSQWNPHSRAHGVIKTPDAVKCSASSIGNPAHRLVDARTSFAWAKSSILVQSSKPGILARGDGGDVLQM